MNEGVEEQLKLERAGFTPDEIASWQTETRTKLRAAGFSEKETDQYFGIHTDPDMSAVKSEVDKNLMIHNTIQKVKQKDNQPKKADSFLDAVEAGFQMSTAGLISRGKLPDVVLPEDAEMGARIASQVSQLVGDVPAMVAGALSMGATAAPSVVGTVPAAMFGAGALPAALRKGLMDMYEKGEIQSGLDFLERTSGIVLDGIKEGGINAASALVGGEVTKQTANMVIPNLAKYILPPLAEVATMTTIAKLGEGKLPDAKDFVDGAVMVGGLHATVAVASKMRNIYSKTAIAPKDLAAKMDEHPTIQQELLSDNIEFPKALEQFVEPEKPLKGISDREAYNPEAIVDSVMKDMLGELQQAQRSQTLIRDEMGNVIDRVDENTYPRWFQEVKSGNLEKTIEDLQKPNSAASKRLRAAAEDRLINGFSDDRSKVQDIPDARFRAARGLEPHEATGAQTGKVIAFDGSDGVIEIPGQEPVHFDASTVKDNFKVGDTVNFILDKNNPDLRTTEMVFGTKTPEQVFQEQAAKTDTIIQKEDGSVTVKTPDGGERPPTDVETILGQIGEKGEKAKTPIDFDSLYTNFVDRTNPINKATGELAKGMDIQADKNPHYLSRMVNDYKAKVKHTYLFGQLDFNTLEKIGPSLKQILEPVSGNAEAQKNLKAYWISKRVLELEARGINSGFNVDAAKNVVEAGAAKFDKITNQLTDFQNSSLKYAKDAGLISDKQFKAMEEAGKSYVSFSRIFSPEEMQSGKGAGKVKSLKSIKGSERLIQDPLKSLMENTEALYKAAEENRAVKALVELADKSEGQTLIEKVKTKQRPIEVSADEIKRALGNSEVGDALVSIMESEGDGIEGFNIFRPMEQRDLLPNQFDAFIDGKRRIFNTTPELAEAVKLLKNNPGSMNVAMKVAATLTSIKKFGITFTPDFIAKNVFRDQLTSSVFSEGRSIPFTEIFTAAGDIIGKREPYENWLKSGGAGGAFMDLNTSFLNKDLLGIAEETGMTDKVYNVIKKPAEYLALASSLLEDSTRLAEFKRVSKGATSGEKVFKGGMAAREVTVDFQRVGAKMSALNSITAFINVGIQGLDRTIRAVKADPAGVAMKGAMYLTAPSLLLWWANKDDERYKEIPRWQKDLFWIIPTDNWQPAKDAAEANGLPKHMVRQNSEGGYEINRGHIYRLPKPQELGMIFATIPERLAEKFFTDNPNALKDFGESVSSLVTPNLIPDFAAPFIEQAVNKNFFTSAPLVTPDKENVLSELQYSDYTSTTARTLGKLIGMVPIAKDIGPSETPLSSPMVIDNYIKSWTGTLGSYAVEVLDRSLEKSGLAPEKVRPSKTWAEIPFIKAFMVRHPSGNAQSIIDFYERSRESDKILNSINMLKKQGDIEGMQKIMDNPEYMEMIMKSSETRKALGEMASVIHNINRAKDMTADEKRQQIDSIYFMMIETARMGNIQMNEWKKAVRENKQ